jgi:hypothetical protein
LAVRVDGMLEWEHRQECLGHGEHMKNLDSVFAAYLIGWGVFFLFYVTIAKRTSDIRAELERLKNTLPRKS